LDKTLAEYTLASFTTFLKQIYVLAVFTAITTCLLEQGRYIHISAIIVFQVH